MNPLADFPNTSPTLFQISSGYLGSNQFAGFGSISWSHWLLSSDIWNNFQHSYLNRTNCGFYFYFLAICKYRKKLQICKTNKYFWLAILQENVFLHFAILTFWDEAIFDQGEWKREEKFKNFHVFKTWMVPSNGRNFDKETSVSDFY